MASAARRLASAPADERAIAVAHDIATADRSAEDDRGPPAAPPEAPALSAILFAVLLLGLISFVFGMFVSVASDLPPLTSFSQYKNAQSSELFDDLGHPIGVLSQQNRVIVTPDRSPRSSRRR